MHQSCLTLQFRCTHCGIDFHHSVLAHFLAVEHCDRAGSTRDVSLRRQTIMRLVLPIVRQPVEAFLRPFSARSCFYGALPVRHERSRAATDEQPSTR